MGIHTTFHLKYKILNFVVLCLKYNVWYISMINQVQKKNRQNILKYVVNYSHSKGLLNIQCVPVTLLYRDYNKKNLYLSFVRYV